MKKINIDDIKVSSKLDTVINNAIDEGYKNTKKKRHKTKIMVAATVAVLFITFSGTNFRNEAFANIKSMISSIGNFLNIDKGLDDYRTIVDKTITKDDASIKVNDVILNGDELMISTTFKSNIALGEKDSIGGLADKIYINGKSVSNDAMGMMRPIDEYSNEQVGIYKLYVGDLSGDLDIGLKYNEIDIFKDGNNDETLSLEGPWAFEFKINGDMLVKETEEKDINYEFELDGEKIRLYKYALNRIGMRIYFKGSVGPYNIELRGKDNLGNDVQLGLTTFNEVSGVMMNTVNKISDKAKTLRLTPYAVNVKAEEGSSDKEYKKVGKEFKIKINR